MNSLFGLLATVTGAVAGQGKGGSFWLPPEGSTSAQEVDSVFSFILWICIFFFVLIVALMVIFIIRYRAKRPDEMGPPIQHNNALEITWTVIPIILVVIIFWLGFKGFMDMVTPPANAYEVQVTGQQWKWLFTYPNGYIDEKLHVPVNRPVTLVMSSDDVIHSLYIPAFRVKRDVFPGRYTKAWFKALKPGTYPIYCAEYCGRNHSGMLTECRVHPPGEFEQWLENASNFLDRMSPEEAGKLLFQQRGCSQCHTVDGTARIGPTLKGVLGHKVVFSDGSSLVADENYLRESMLEPAKRVVAGFEPVMPTQQGRLKNEEIAAIIAYIKSLGD